MKPLARLAAYLAVVLASVLGSASLLLLVSFLFLGNFHFFQLGLGSTTALAWDALLSAAFFLQHSGMVRRSFRQRLEPFVSDPFHGLIFTIASASTLTLCLILWQRAGEPIGQLDGAPAWLMRILFILAIAGFAWGVRALGSFDTFGIRRVVALLRNSQTRQHPFVVKGPYRWVRHPLYFFALVLFWSCPAITPDRLLFNILWTVWVVLATFLEERDLVYQFGDPYIQYQREVPMIFPWRISPPGPPARPPANEAA
ncbi:MAG: isoprenylcysteine carboxylmethyltransferase family protein [Gemmatimonadota bacterium]|nr:isoprenylcysteine carboxylmethyltransferase family protein [Gemmatimonadota bacterium]